jgi:hypothetical protein
MMPDAVEVGTLASVMEEVGRRGFTAHFMAEDGVLRAAGSATRYAAGDVTISEYHRFEGVSDPDDMSILYAIQTRSGVRGTLVDAFGVYADPRVGDFIEDVRVGASSTR